MTISDHKSSSRSARVSRALVLVQSLCGTVAAALGCIAVFGEPSRVGFVGMVMAGATYIAWAARNFFVCRHARHLLLRNNARRTAALFRGLGWGSLVLLIGGMADGTLMAGTYLVNVFEVRAEWWRRASWELRGAEWAFQLASFLWCGGWVVALALLHRSLRAPLRSALAFGSDLVAPLTSASSAARES